jgi:hypothetical protein
VASVDDEHPGIRNGGRVRRRRVRPADDERPRGFKPQRMRQLWDDIDDARDKLGLGAAATAAPSTWSVSALVGRALEMTAGATNHALEVTAGVTTRAFTVTADATSRALEMTASATTWVAGLVPAGVQRRTCGRWLTRVPIVGRLLALVPGGASRAE